LVFVSSKNVFVLFDKESVLEAMRENAGKYFAEHI